MELKRRVARLEGDAKAKVSRNTLTPLMQKVCSAVRAYLLAVRDAADSSATDAAVAESVLKRTTTDRQLQKWLLESSFRSFTEGILWHRVTAELAVRLNAASTKQGI